MVFILSAIGSGIEKIIEKNTDPSLLTMIQNKEILFPLIGFFVILIISFLLRKKFTLKNENILSNDPSPYLQQHKNNPVHWQTWSRESLNQAKTEKKTDFIEYWLC